MRSQLDLYLSPKATRDLDAIYDYTEAEWGTKQAESYTKRIRTACETLTERPRTGRSVDNLRLGYRVINCGSHNIFFREEKSRIVAVRILHGRMDPARHL